MKINSNLNKNFNTQKKQPTFGVRKSDSVQSFINEIKASNFNLGNLERLPIVQKMKESDTLEHLKERANANRSMFENKCSFNIANEKGFTTFINSICIKIMNELKELGNTVKKFIVQIEDENGKKKKSNIVEAFKNRLYVKASYKKNPERRKEYDKKYYGDNKDEILEKQKEYRQNNKDKILEKQKEYRQNNPEKIKESSKKYYEDNKDKILEKQKEYRQNNSEEIKEYQKKYQKEYRQNNSEKIKEYNKEYYLKKKEKATLKKQEKEVREFLSELINQIMEKAKQYYL